MSATANTEQQLLQGLSTAVVLLDNQLRVVQMNLAAESLLAISFRQSAGKPIKKVMRRAQAFVARLQQALSEMQPYTERAYTIPVNGDREVLVDCCITPMLQQDKASLVVEMFNQDHMHKINREEHLLEQRLTSQQMARGIAHEIKNPLSGLRGAAQLLERELPSAELREYTEVIIAEADRLQSLVDRMLGSSQPLQFKPVNIHQVLERVRSLLKMDIQRQLTLKFDYDPSIPEIQADENLLMQAVLNLARNAAEIVSPDSGIITFRSRIERSATIAGVPHRLVVRIDIEDNGAGIAPDMIERIFYPMVTTRPEGTGLGLPVAQGAIGRHQGLIECNSRPGKTVFTILLPFTQPQPAPILEPRLQIPPANANTRSAVHER